MRVFSVIPRDFVVKIIDHTRDFDPHPGPHYTRDFLVKIIYNSLEVCTCVFALHRIEYRVTTGLDRDVKIGENTRM